jgi:pimeloyl-ACP methyl ester carboxylesterase
MINLKKSTTAPNLTFDVMICGAEDGPAPYQFVELPRIGHFAADQAPDQVAALLLAYLAAHPA